MIIYYDSAPAIKDKVINRFGKIQRTKLGFTYAVTDSKGNELAKGINTKIDWQIEGEAYAFLKAIEWIEENITEATSIDLYGDNETVVNLHFESKTKAGIYMKIALDKMHDLSLSDIVVYSRWCEGELNKADKLSKGKS